MADLRFNLETAIERLRRHGKDAAEQLAGQSAVLEAELRAVAAAIHDGARIDVDGADSLHVMKIDTDMTIPAGSTLNLGAYHVTANLGSSVFAQTLERGRYRVIVQFTRLPDEERKERRR